MPNSYFQFKQFRIEQEYSGMKVTTDGCLFGAWIASLIGHELKEPKRILDIGSGTGLLALMLAQSTQSSQIDAIEINEKAFLEAQSNFSLSPWNDRLTNIHTSVQAYEAPIKYDLIICNPPFFKKNALGKNPQKNQAVHNESLSMEALSAGIHSLLSPSGNAFILYPEWEMKAFIKWMEKVKLYPNKQAFVRNRERAPVFRTMTSFSSNELSPPPEELIVRADDGKYSVAIERLFHPYYL